MLPRSIWKLCSINVTAELVFYVIKFAVFIYTKLLFRYRWMSRHRGMLAMYSKKSRNFAIVEAWSCQCPLVVSFYVVEVASKSPPPEVYIDCFWSSLVSKKSRLPFLFLTAYRFCYVSAQWWYGEASWRVYNNVDEGRSIRCGAWHHLLLLAPVYRRQLEVETIESKQLTSLCCM